HHNIQGSIPIIIGRHGMTLTMSRQHNGKSYGGILQQPRLLTEIYVNLCDEFYVNYMPEL
ncbi:MAG TPA: hypothetical protein VFV68_01605, partial [Agriterribacter sp.]|nr:hypothetical protein [Agriterribacter sp.]